VKFLLRKSKRYHGYSVRINPEDESLAIEDPGGNEVAALVLEDFLARLGATSNGFKRKFPRLGMGIFVKYLDAEGDLRQAIASTIGGGGLFIEGLDPLPKGTRTRLEFSLPASRNVIIAEANVVWVRKNFIQRVRFPGMGLEFSEISDEARAELLEFVNRFNRERGLEEGPPPPT